MEILSAQEILETAVQIEKSGFAFYDEVLKQKKLTKEMKELIEKLRDQEREHEHFFKKLRDSSEDIQLLDPGSDTELISNYLRSIISYRLFTNDNAAIQAVNRSENEIEVLESAIRFEKDTILYFQGINDLLVDPEIKNILSKIIMEEISHVLWLTLNKDKLIKH